MTTSKNSECNRMSNYYRNMPSGTERLPADFDYNIGTRVSSMNRTVTWHHRLAWPNGRHRTCKKPRLIASLGNPDDLKAYIKPGEWNQVEIIADGHTLIHIVNGHVMATLVDTDPKYYQAKARSPLRLKDPAI